VKLFLSEPLAAPYRKIVVDVAWWFDFSEVSRVSGAPGRRDLTALGGQFDQRRNSKREYRITENKPIGFEAIGWRQNCS
jgi:hypothetical protein